MIDQLISDFSNKQLTKFLRYKNSSFVDYQEDFTHIISDYEKFDNLIKLGEIEYENTDKLIVFTCMFKGELTSRSARKTQFELAKKVLKEDFNDGAVFVFYNQAGRFRFSFIRRNYGDRIQKYTPWKRYTYFVEPDAATNRTYKERIENCKFDSLDNIQEAFSVEPISKEFFDGYKAQYEKFCKYMQTDKKMLYNFKEFLSDGTNKAIRDYVKKMLGRIVFLHFLQKKGWMGVPNDSKNWTKGDQNFIENLFNCCTKEQRDNFLDDVLEPLFFNSLNTQRDNDLYDTKTALGVVKIPYLNGGLFEPDSLDQPNSVFPTSYFEELFQFFNKYNFTIDENDPNDAEVGVDPEMLGHIFENLLEDNKDKGAFYTPKDVVHYMCQISLTEYLLTNLNINSFEEKESIKHLVSYHEITDNLNSKIKDIDNALDNVKICDPAIGSGAFPMGLLHEIFSVKQALWFFEKQDLENFPACEVKLNIIQNSIYGVDVEKGAVDIARLRFWLSMVVDEVEPQTLPNLDYKIVCGDSLLSRFPLDVPIKDVFSEYNKDQKKIFTLKDYQNLLNNYTNIHEGKIQYRNKIEEIKGAFKNELLKRDLTKRKKKEVEVLEYETVSIFGERKADNDKVGYIKAKAELKSLLNSEKEILKNNVYKNSFEWRFEFPSLLDEDGNFNGFDIIIANPPYIGQKGNKKLFEPFVNNPYFEKKMDYWYFFLHKSYSLTKKSGVNTFITPNYWITAQGGKKLRKKILENYSIVEYINFNENTIFDAGIHTNIFVLKKDENPNSNIKCTIYQNKYSNDIFSYRNNELIFFADQNNIFSSWTGFIHFLPSNVSNVLNHLVVNCEKLSDNESEGEKVIGSVAGKKVTNGICNINQGIISGKDRLKDKKSKLNEGVFIITKQELELLNLDDNELKYIKPFIKNSDIDKFSISTKELNNYIIYVDNVETETEFDSLVNIKNHFLKYRESLGKRYINGVLESAYKKGKWWSLIHSVPFQIIKNKKIVCPQRNKRNLFAIDKGETYASADVYYISPNLNRNNYSLNYILAILNSQMVYFWLYWMGKRKGELLELYFEPLQFIPIKECENRIQNLFEKKINEILELRLNDKPTKKYEQEIDNLIYRLYNLAYDEVKVIDPEIEHKISEVDYNAIEI